MKNLNILILEDEIFSYMNINRSLKKIGFYNTFLAKNEDEFKKLLGQYKIDLIFSDIKIGGAKDGIDLISEMEEKYNMPVIFISGSKDRETYIKTSAIRSFSGFLVKPYREEDFKAITLITIFKYNLDCELIILDKEHRFDRNKKELYYKNKLIELSKKELILLDLLVTNINMYVTIPIIEEYLWDDLVNDSTRRTAISRFKQKVPNLKIKIKRNVGLGIFN